MSLSWKLGRIAGIDVSVHPTFLLVLLLPWPLLLILSLFGCVLLHELGHALMARRFGIGTQDITLYPIGGVARLRRMPRAPGAELLIALAGPAVNFAIVAALTTLAFLGLDHLLAQTLAVAFSGFGWDPIDVAMAVGDYLSQVMYINLGLGLFNLIPAFPMDGGRVLRALLSGWLGRAPATTIAATIGQTLAVCFGIFSLLVGNPLHVALAAFIFFAARAEETHVLADERRRQAPAGQGEGIWVAPPGYRWVHQGNGVWQLAPVVVRFADPSPDGSRWRF
ncbi:MAG TPA: site-2 protease family protein [Isosphaeraceae bacterium]|nr:site-2 protease family protein [Isosphaeraceae bacterium]